MTTRFGMILTLYAVQIPFYVIWLVGIILAIVFWKKHPKASLLAMIGLVGIFVLNIVGVYTNAFLSLDLYERGMSSAEIGMAMGIRTIVFNILGAGFWGLIIASIFVDRKQASVMPQIPNRY